MADIEENVSLNEDETLGDLSDEDTKCTLNADENDDTVKTFKDLVGWSEAGLRYRHIKRAN